MKKYTYLTFKTVIPSLLLIAIIITACAFFFGGLKASALQFDNIEWDLEGFVNASDLEAAGTINTDVLVGENATYCMVIDETTTIVSIYRKGVNWNSSEPRKNATKLYSTAIEGTDKEPASNITLNYYSENGVMTTINSFEKSVQYENATTGNKDRYYQIRYNASSNSVDILYTIGDFNPYIFSKQMNYLTFEEKFVGNTLISADLGSKKVLTDIYDLAGNPASTVAHDGKKWVETNKGYIFSIDYLITTSKEVAIYILENELGYLTSGAAIDVSKPVSPFSLHEYNEEAVEKINSTPVAYWIIYGCVSSFGTLNLKLGVDYNCENSPIKINPFLTIQALRALINHKDAYQIVGQYEDGTENTTYEIIPFNAKEIIEIRGYKDLYLKNVGSFSPNIKKELYKTFYVGAFRTNSEGVDIYEPNYYLGSYSAAIGLFPIYFQDKNEDGQFSQDEYFVFGGYPLKDEDGNYLYNYDEDGNIVSCVQAGLKVEDSQAENEHYDNPDATKVVAFQIGLRISLVGNSMEVALANNAIREGVGENNTDPNVASYYKHNMKLGEITVCKYMTVSSNPNKDGQIILPDGSGAVFSFNSNKGSQYAFMYPEKRIYGTDFAIPQMQMGFASQPLTLAMYGYLETTDKKGVVAIVDKGGAQTAISANFRREGATAGMGLYNYSHFVTYLREKETIQVTSTTSYLKQTPAIYQGDIVYKYVMLDIDELTYVGVANKYRNYLISKYNLDSNGDQTKTATPTISFAGAYEKKTLKFAFVVDKEYSLTTFEQATDIINELIDNGVDSMNVSYYGWTKDEFDVPISGDVNVSKVLGGKKELMKLNEYLTSLGFGFYPDYSLTSGRGYDLAFGSLKYNSKSIAGSYSNAVDFVLSSGLEDTSRRRGAYISPKYYVSLMETYLNNYKKLDLTGIALNDVGNARKGDYSKNAQIFTAGGVMYQQEAMQRAIDEDVKLYLVTPYDYAFQYTSVATFVPNSSTLYGIIDYSIPLYQLVISGLFDYSSAPINYMNDQTVQWNFLKALETGCNLEFYLSASDTSVLIDTRYSDLYGTFYGNSRNNIIDYTRKLNESGIYESRLVNHEYLTDTVVRVTYENGLTIIINYGVTSYHEPVSGLGIKSNSYYIVSGGTQ